MKNQSTGLLWAMVLLSAGCAWGQMASSGMSGTYTQFEALTLKKSPHHAWARSIAFRDELSGTPAGKPQRLDRRTYIPLELKTAGTAWIREDRIDQFLALPPDTPFTFGGTVDQFNRRYYLILDAAFQVETLPSQEERWTDVLANPPTPPAPDILPDETAAADLPEPPPSDDGPAEPISGESPSWSEVMTDIVGITDDTPPSPPVIEAVPDEYADVATLDVPEYAGESAAAAPEAPLEETLSGLEDLFDDEPAATARDETVETADLPEDTSVPDADDFDFPPALPIEVAEVPPAVEDVQEFDAGAGTGIPEESPAIADAGDEEPPAAGVPDAEPEAGDTALAAADDDTPAAADDDALAAADDTSDSYHVEPMGDSAPVAIVPLVSLKPTKAELADQEARSREAAREDAIRQKEAERQAQIEAKRQREAEAKRQKAEAAARKKAEAEARAELERTRREAEAARKAEEKRLREEEAAAIAAMEAREAQERETAARIAAREATQKERDALAARIESEKAAIAERARMAREVTAAEQAIREEAERLAREETERQEALLAEKAQMEAELAALAEQEREMTARIAAEQAAREKAERVAREETKRQAALLAEKKKLEAELAARAERERAAAERLAAEQAAREEAERAAAAARETQPAAGQEEPKLSRRERRELERAERAAQAKAEAAAKAAADAAAKAAEAEPAAPQTGGDLPEWMQPVVF